MKKITNQNSLDYLPENHYYGVTVKDNIHGFISRRGYFDGVFIVLSLHKLTIGNNYDTFSHKTLRELILAVLGNPYFSIYRFESLVDFGSFIGTGDASRGVKLEKDANEVPVDNISEKKFYGVSDRNGRKAFAMKTDRGYHFLSFVGEWQFNSTPKPTQKELVEESFKRFQDYNYFEFDTLKELYTWMGQ